MANKKTTRADADKRQYGIPTSKIVYENEDGSHREVTVPATRPFDLIEAEQEFGISSGQNRGVQFSMWLAHKALARHKDRNERPEGEFEEWAATVVALVPIDEDGNPIPLESLL